MHQGCLPAQIGKLCSKRSGRIASGRSRSAETPSSALSHGQDPKENFTQVRIDFGAVMVGKKQ